MTVRVQLVSPEKVLFEGDGEMVVCRTLGGGDIAFLEGHEQFLGGLETHPVRVIMADGTERAFAVHGGFVEVANSRVIVLSDVAELSDDVDLIRAEEAKNRAERRIAANADDFTAVMALRRANVRIAVAKGEQVA